MALLFAFAPLFFAFEIWQLVIAEKAGLTIADLDVIESNEAFAAQACAVVKELGLGELKAAGWSLILLGYWAWMTLMLFQPLGRFQFLMLLGVSGLGFAVRRGCGLKWVLVILTFEGSIRIGMLVSLCALAWRRLL